MANATSIDTNSRDTIRSVIADVVRHQPRVVSHKLVEKMIDTGEMESGWVTIPNPNQLGQLDGLIIGSVAALMRDYPAIVKELRPDLYDDSPYTTAILDLIAKEVEQHGFAVMRVYPSDILIADRAFLNAHAAPDVQFAICIGDRHTHITTVGLEDDATKLTKSLSNLASSDQYYVVTCLSEPGEVQWKCVTRTSFEELSATPSRYSSCCDGSVVTVKRLRDPSDPRTVGQAAFVCEQEPRAGLGGRWSIHLYPSATATPRDLIGLRRHAVRELEKRYTLFVNYSVHIH